MIHHIYLQTTNLKLLCTGTVLMLGAPGSLYIEDHINVSLCNFLRDFEILNISTNFCAQFSCSFSFPVFL